MYPRSCRPSPSPLRHTTTTARGRRSKEDLPRVGCPLNNDTRSSIRHRQQPNITCTRAGGLLHSMGREREKASCSTSEPVGLSPPHPVEAHRRAQEEDSDSHRQGPREGCRGDDRRTIAHRPAGRWAGLIDRRRHTSSSRDICPLISRVVNPLRHRPGRSTFPSPRLRRQGRRGVWRGMARDRAPRRLLLSPPRLQLSSATSRLRPRAAPGFLSHLSPTRSQPQALSLLHLGPLV